MRHDEILGAASAAEDPGPGRLVQLVEGLVGGHEDGEVAGPGQQLAQLRGLQRGHHGLEVEVGGENLGDGVHGRHQHAVHHVHHAVGRGVVPGDEYCEEISHVVNIMASGVSGLKLLRGKDDSFANFAQELFMPIFGLL